MQHALIICAEQRFTHSLKFAEFSLQCRTDRIRHRLSEGCSRLFDVAFKLGQVIFDEHSFCISVVESQRNSVVCSRTLTAQYAATTYGSRKEACAKVCKRDQIDITSV